MADEATDPNAEIRLFYTAAGVAQYMDKLIDEGFDKVANILVLDELGLQTLQSAVNMKTGHLATLRAKIGQEAPLGAPLRAAAAPMPAAKVPAAEPAPPPCAAANKKAIEYAAAAGDDIAAMASVFETKYKQQQYGNCMETYTNSNTHVKLYEFLGRSTNSKPANQPVFKCACSPNVIRLAGQWGHNAESHLTRKEHWQYYRHVSFGEPLKQANVAAWLAFQAGNKKSMSHQNTSQYKKRRQATEARRAIADSFLAEDANKAPRPPATTTPLPAATHAVPAQDVDSGGDDYLFGEGEAMPAQPEAAPTVEAVGGAAEGGAAVEEAPAAGTAPAQETAAPEEESPPPPPATRTPLDAMAAWAAALSPPGYVQAGNGSL